MERGFYTVECAECSVAKNGIFNICGIIAHGKCANGEALLQAFLETGWY